MPEPRSSEIDARADPLEQRSVSADQQKNDTADLDATRRLRRSVVTDDALSTAEHNVTIIAVDGTVTLKGMVRSQEEKRIIVMKAVEVVGRDHVFDELKVAPQK